jgi:nitrogenase molybdenum-iron protein NifN
MPTKKQVDPFVSTTNACKLCTPLGACIAFKGIEGCVPFLHGSQGCATYMRRYIISHYREPVDIASSSLGEKHAVYGGGPNLKQGLLTVMKKYGAPVIGIASTCLTETIGDDVPMTLHEFRQEFGDLDLADLIHCSTPSYSGTHMNGFHAAVRASVEQVAQPTEHHGGINCFPGFVSPADIRHLQDVFADFGAEATILPDISETLDGQALDHYQKIPSGGTPISAIRAMPGASASFEFGRLLATDKHTAGTHLNTAHGVALHRIGLPIGLRETDVFFETLEAVTGREMPRKHALERGRLVDAYVDAHKYLSGKTAVVYGEEDLLVGLISFLAEIGVQPVLVGTGAESKKLAPAIEAVAGGLLRDEPAIRQGVDFWEMSGEAKELQPDLVIGSSKGYRVIARELGVPLVRVGFPIHDRFGAQRTMHLGYHGAQALFDRIVNAVIEKKQADSPIGYGYI